MYYKTNTNAGCGESFTIQDKQVLNVSTCLCSLNNIQDTKDYFPLRYYKTNIQGASSGKLSGKRVAIKDNVCVSGVPMMVGSHLLEGYMPKVDATVVTRILDEGMLWLSYDMETVSVLLTVWDGNPSVTGGLTSQWTSLVEPWCCLWC